MFKDKVVVVTGGVKGIGKCIAEEFEKAGAKVCIIDILDNPYFVGDIAKEKVLQDFANKVIAEHGKVDILVNNAGIAQSTPLYQYTAEEFDKIIDLNVKAVFYTILPAAKIMKEQGGGCIINTSSMVSFTGQPSGVGYPASKYAVNGITVSLARELTKDNIRVNAVAPGVTRTDMVAALPEEMVKRISATIPLGRPGEPEEVANAFLFLASDMAQYVTGEILSVDGAAKG